ncbi:Protein of unknown function, putative [Plasmodium vivax]|nr:Protein of unknown function, putative [Plasmodium vivax]
MKENFSFEFFIKSAVFFYFTWIYFLCDNVSSFTKDLYDRSNLSGTSGRITHRIMANDELGAKSNFKGLSVSSSIYGDNKKLENYKEHASIYAKLERSDSNNLEKYKKALRRKYSKKKGIYKLDCYCEQKIFNRIDKIYKVAKNVNNDRNSINKIINKKYGLKFVLLCLYPLTGLVMPWLSSLQDKTSGTEYDYSKTILGKTGLPHEAATSISAILIISCFIVLSVIIYIIIKFIKYEKLKAGKGKMSVMEYCHFCSEIL